MNGLVVMKFGGTSVENADAMQRICPIILAERRKRIVVVSACAGVTNSLIEAARLAASKKVQEAISISRALHLRHVQIAKGLLGETGSSGVIDILNSEAAGLSRILQSICVLGELSARSLDFILNFGERWSSLLLARFLLHSGAPVELFEAGKVIVTDSVFNRAAPHFHEIEKRAQRLLVPLLANGKIVVTQGFIGSTFDGIPVTIGRGGSDYSAAILGAALHCDEIQIWTDVDGILTADPAVLPDARPIRELTFDEASELAYFGARVLHPGTILPAMKKDIPVRVLNSKKPESPGTLIRRIKATNGCSVKSIAYKEGITVITIKSTEMLLAHDFLSRLFGIFEKHKGRIDVIATAKVSVSLTIDDDTMLDRIVAEVSGFAEVQVERNKAVFCVVGENMRSTRGIASRVFGSLDHAGVNVDVISHGASRINLTFVIDEAHIEPAVRALHQEFFGRSFISR